MMESRHHERRQRQRRQYRWTRKKMSFLILIIFLISNVDSNPAAAAAAAAAAVGKCCPFGQVFSVKENFTCAYSEDRNRQIYHLKNNLNYKDFEGCEDSKNLTITSLIGEIGNGGGVIGAASACIDLLWDEKIGQSIPIVFQCHDNEAEENNSEIFPPTTTATTTTSPPAANFPSPILTSLRICCPPNTAFDTNKRDCVYAKAADHDVLNYLKFLDGKIDFVSIVRGPPKCNHASLDYVVNATRDLRVLDDGRLEMMLSASKDGRQQQQQQQRITRIIMNEENSCLDPGNNRHVHRLDDTFDNQIMISRICTGPKYCEKNTCVRKCCPEDEAIFDISCDKLPDQLPPGRFHHLLLNASISRGMEKSVEFIDTLDYGLMFGNSCGKYGMFPVEPNEDWHITRLGQLDLPLYRVYENHEYCMDIFYENARNNNAEQPLLYPFVCFDESTQFADESPLRYKIFAILELTSCTFLLITLLVYICLPVLRNLHGKTLMCHVASLIVAYATLATVALATPSKPGGGGGGRGGGGDDHPNEGAINFCKFLGFTLLFSWIAAFSWLNVMCFDIWWTFGGLAGSAGRRGKAYRRRFLMYSLYAWGLALSLTIIGLVVDHTTVLPLYLRPNVASDSCWFERNVHYYGEIIFFVGPVSIQLVANVIFFILTAMYCGKVKAEITRVMASPNDPRSTRFRADKAKLIINVKLFIVMGVSWSLEVISSYLNHYATSIAWRNEFFYLFDFFNCLQGLMIFILFVLKSKVYYALGRRLGRRERKKIPAARQGHGGMGLQDPYRVRNSASGTTIMSTFGISASPS